MQFTRLALRNWRNFTRVDVPLRSRVFIVGPNAAGKSNLLDAFRFLRDVASPRGGLQSAVSARGGVSKIRCLAARQDPAIALDIQIGENSDEPFWRYRLSIRQDTRRFPQITEELVERDGKTLLLRPDSDDGKDNERLQQTHLEQVTANREFRPISEFLQSIRYCHAVPPLMRQPQLLVPGRDPARESFSSDFPEQIARVAQHVRSSRLRRINEALRLAVPQLQELALERKKTGRPHLESRYEHWRPRPARQREDQFSDGTLRLTALLWAAMDGGGPLLLEEPELNLHPGVVRSLPQLIYRATLRRGMRRQTVISTHSCELLSDEGIGADEVLLLHPDDDGTRVEAAHDSMTIVNLLEGGLSAAEAVLEKTAPKNVRQLSFVGM